MVSEIINVESNSTQSDEDTKENTKKESATGEGIVIEENETLISGNCITGKNIRTSGN